MFKLKSALFYKYIDQLYQSVPVGVYEGMVFVFCLGTVLLLLLYGARKGVENSLKLLTAEYISFILCSTVLFRSCHENVGYSITPFWSYVAIQNGRTDLMQANIMNVAIFIPIGVLLGCLSKRLKWWMVALIGVGISLTIEILQYLLKRGFAEVDDVMHNTLGCLIGFLMVAVIKGMWKLSRMMIGYATRR